MMLAPCSPLEGELRCLDLPASQGPLLVAVTIMVAVVTAAAEMGTAAVVSTAAMKTVTKYNDITIP